MDSLKPILGMLLILLLSAGIILAGSQGSAAISRIPLFLLCACVGFILHWLVFIPSFLLQTEHYFDVTGSLSFILAVALAAYLHPFLDLRGLILCVLIAIWAARLGTFLFLRGKRAGGETRFVEIKPHFWPYLFAWTLGGGWVFITMAAGLAAITSMTQRPLGMFVILGVLLWMIGFGIEVIADRQKSRFRNQAENADNFITTGLWSYSRHPNYFGEILLWIGIAVIALPTLVGWQFVTLISPLFVAFLLIRVSGVKPPGSTGTGEMGNQSQLPAVHRKHTYSDSVYWNTMSRIVLTGGLTMNMCSRILTLLTSCFLLISSAHAQIEPNPVALEGASSYTYKTIGDIELRLHVFGASSDSPTPAIVFFFGGGWRNGSINQFVPQSLHLSERGMTAIIADYRVLNRHGTDVFAALADAKSAIRWVREHSGRLGIDPDRVVAAGGSAGGHLAAATAALGEFDEIDEDLTISSEPNALVLFNPAVNTGGIGGNREEQFRGRALDLSPYHHLDDPSVPTIIVHGKADTTVPYSTVEDYCRKVTDLKGNCQLHGYEGATHGFFNKGRFDDQWYKSTLLEVDRFLTELGYLPTPAPTAIH